MHVRAARAVLLPKNGYVCLSCRLQRVGAETGRTRRYQHTGSKDEGGTIPENKITAKKSENEEPSAPSSRIREIIRGFMGGQKTQNQDQVKASPVKTQDVQRQTSTPVASPVSVDDARQQKLQQQFAEQRRKDLLEMQTDKTRKVEARRGGAATIRRVRGTKERPASHRSRSARRTHNREMASKRLKKATMSAPTNVSERVVPSPLHQHEQEMVKKRPGSSTLSGPVHESQLTAAPVDHASDQANTRIVQSESSTDPENLAIAREKGQHPLKSMKSAETKASIEEAIVVKGKLSEASLSAEDTIEKQRTTSQKPKPKPRSKIGGSKKSASKSEKEPGLQGRDIAPTEAERKAKLADRLEAEGKKTKGTIRKYDTEAKNPSVSRPLAKSLGSQAMRKMQSKQSVSATDITNVEGFESLESAIGDKASKAKNRIENADATKLEILPVAVHQPPVPTLSYGLERVLFNPGVYQLQDPRSRVYNFNPYLQKIMPVTEFDFNALKEYITSSRDETLKRIAKEQNKRYVGSTSSMTGVLAHFHFLLSQWRPINATMLSKTFPTYLTSFTELQRSPSAIFLRWKDGSYAIDADKQFQNASVLSMLGKSMEKLLTLDTDNFERYRKSSLGQVTEDEQFAPESYHYSTMGDFLMRSQLDAYDPRLPGTGMFDLKTRAVVSIRMDVSNYEQGTGYQIKSRQGEWESYEREYYDMIRAAFLKYSMQVRMGRMDGIFVAFHNVERIFGFQYISLPEMDSTIHGQWDTSIGDQEFKLSLDLLNKALDKATARFPETSIRLHFETREAQTPFMYIFAEPVTEEQVAEIQNANDVKIREFERSILGVKRGDGTESSEAQEGDGKWEDIQADVQKEMDKDELSMSDLRDDQETGEAEELDVEDNGRVSEIQGIIEEGPLYTSKRTTDTGDDATAAATEYVDDDDGEIEVAEDENTVDAAKDGPQRGLDVSEETYDGIEEIDKSEVGDRVSGGEIAQDAGTVTIPGMVIAEADEEIQAFDQVTITRSDDEVEATSAGDQPLEEESEGSSAQDAPTSSSVMGHAAKPLSPKEQKKKAKANHTSGVGEEQSIFHTEADQPFLDAIDQESLPDEESIDNRPDILAMTLTLRNKVNGQYTLRPEELTDKDKWSIEYSLNEVPTQRKARALYEACQVRRKKRIDRPLVPEDEETINVYIQKLRKLSRTGRDWREEQDRKDNEKPVQVVGQETAKTGEREV